MKSIFKAILLFIAIAITHFAVAQTSPKNKVTQPAKQKKLTMNEVLALRKAKIDKSLALITADLNDVEAHFEYQFHVGWTDSLLKSNYKTWLDNNRFTANTLLRLSQRVSEQAEAKVFLLKAITLDTTNAEIWNRLAVETAIAGDRFAASEYYKKATTLAPDNMKFALGYMYSLKYTDTAKYRATLATFDERFPNTSSSVNSMYQYALLHPDTASRIQILEKIVTKYAGHKDWINSYADILYTLYLQTNPQKAAQLAFKNGWAPKVVQAQKMAQIQELSAQKRYDDALAVMDSLAQIKNLYQNYLFVFKKAQLYNLAGTPRRAYDTLMKRMTADPSKQTHNLLVRYGEKLDKQESDVTADWLKILNKNATIAPGFSSQLYTSDKRISLSDYRGKVVFITFWFPGCGPCRAEFPHVENVMKKVDRDKVVYLSINGMPEQDGNVLSVIEHDKLTFTPLHGSRKVEQLFKFSGYPYNILIDKQGKIVFKHFRTDEENEDALELMINTLVNADEAPAHMLMVDSTKMKK
ncbi:MAG: redoxin domain-containing protein [Bacteroidota bacterium]